MQLSMILDTYAYIYDAANFVTDGRTNGRTDKAILGVGYIPHEKDHRTKTMIVVMIIPDRIEQPKGNKEESKKESDQASEQVDSRQRSSWTPYCG